MDMTEKQADEMITLLHHIRTNCLFLLGTLVYIATRL